MIIEFADPRSLALAQNLFTDDSLKMFLDRLFWNIPPKFVYSRSVLVESIKIDKRNPEEVKVVLTAQAANRAYGEQIPEERLWSSRQPTETVQFPDQLTFRFLDPGILREVLHLFKLEGLVKFLEGMIVSLGRSYRSRTVVIVSSLVVHEGQNLSRSCTICLRMLKALPANDRSCRWDG